MSNLDKLSPSLSLTDESDEIEVSSRDTNILRAIQEEGLTVFTFYGLRRLLGVHQETLSRILDRLVDDGFVEKVPEGYRLTPKGEEIVPRQLSSSTPHVPILQSLLPEDLDVDRVVGGLKGRWFGNLRWLGYTQNDEGVVLKWITEEDGVQVDAKFADGFLTIDARGGEAKNVGVAVRASHQLLGHISRLYRGPRQPGRFASPVAYYPDTTWVWPVTYS